MNISVLHFLRTTFAVGCAMGLSGAALAQQEPAGNVIPPRFYETLAAAATKAGAENTKRVGGEGGYKFFDVRLEGAVLVGFEAWVGDYTNHLIIRGIRGIFQTAHGRVAGALHGQKTGPSTKVEAKDGYAVAAIEARGGDRLDGIQVLFWKIRGMDVSLEAEGSYKSEWIGGRGGKKPLHPLTSNGNPVIGISGASGDDVDRLGLIYYDRH